MILILWIEVSSCKNTDGSDETKPGEGNLTKLTWRTPILKLSDKYSLELLSDIKDKKDNTSWTSK